MTKKNDWTYKGKKFILEEFREEYTIGFVYLITNTSNGKMYVGKKLFWKVVKRPPLKGAKRKRISKVESDWKDYYGSSDKVRELIETTGTGIWKREILKLCRSKGEMTYYEMREQFDRHVLLSDQYYNEFIGGKLHSAHLRELKNDFTP